MIRRALVVALLVAVYLAVRVLWMPAPGSTSEQVAPVPAQPALNAAVALLDAGVASPGQGSAAVPAGAFSPVPLKASLTPNLTPAGRSPTPRALVAFPAPDPGATPGGQSPGSGPGSAVPAASAPSIPPLKATVSSPPSGPTLSPLAGVVSPGPAGDWVTSISGTARYYCHVSAKYWEGWADGNRVWFATESDLLAAYPGRLRHGAEPTASPSANTSSSVASPTALAVAPVATPTPISTPTATGTPAATSIVVAPSSTATLRPAATVPPGGVVSPDPAGDWVTSTHSSTTYYTTRDNEVRWMEWAAANRIWFASEEALLAAYPWRIFDAPVPTSTPKASSTPVAPTATRTPTTPPTATRTPTPSPTAAPATSTPDPTATATHSPTGTPTSTLEPSPAPTLEPSQTPTETPSPTPEPPTATPEPPEPTPTSTPGGVMSPEPAGDWVTSVAEETKYYCSRDSSYWEIWGAEMRIWFQTEDDLLAVYPGRIRR